jgi:hypothetical protein
MATERQAHEQQGIPYSTKKSFGGKEKCLKK